MGPLLTLVLLVSAIQARHLLVPGACTAADGRLRPLGVFPVLEVEELLEKVLVEARYLEAEERLGTLTRSQDPLR